MSQIWSNIRLNCGLTDTLAVHSALDIRGPPLANNSMTWSFTPQCGQNLTVASPDWSAPSLYEFSLQHNVSSAGLAEYNPDINSNGLDNGTYCAPLSCNIAMVDSDVGGPQFLDNHPEFGAITISQFLAWNPSAIASQLTRGDYVCIG